MLRAAFSSPRSQFFTIRTEPKPQITYLSVISHHKLAYKWVYATLLLNSVAGLTCCLRTIVKIKSNERVT